MALQRILWLCQPQCQGQSNLKVWDYSKDLDLTPSFRGQGIYQRYMTWFDGHPARLWLYPPTEEGQRYIECFGGVEALCEKAEQFISKGDNRFAATLLSHAIAGYPESPNPRAKELLASAYEHLGFGAENAIWRNFYLTGAQELRTGKKSGMVAGGKTPLGPQLTVGQWFDILSVQLDGERAAKMSLTIDLNVTDVKEKWRLILSNGVLTRRFFPAGIEPNSQEKVNLSMVLTRVQLLGLLRGDNVTVEKQEGDMKFLYDLLDLTNVEQGSVRGPAQL